MNPLKRPQSPLEKAYGEKIDRGSREVAIEVLKTVVDASPKPTIGLPLNHPNRVAAAMAYLKGQAGPVRKAASRPAPANPDADPAEILVYAADGSPGSVAPSDVHDDPMEKGDVAVFDSPGAVGFKGYADPKKVAPLATSATKPAPGPTGVPVGDATPPTPPAPGRAPVQGAAPLAPVQKRLAPRWSNGAAVALIAGLGEHHLQKIVQSPPTHEQVQKALGRYSPDAVQRAERILETNPRHAWSRSILGLGQAKTMVFEPGDHGEIMRAGQKVRKSLSPENSRWLEATIKSLPQADQLELKRQIDHFCRGSQGTNA